VNIGANLKTSCANLFLDIVLLRSNLGETQRAAEAREDRE
jgi:hypothetical protein